MEVYMFKNQEILDVKMETTEEFLTRGGKVKQIAEGSSYKRKTKRKSKVNAQALLDAAEGTPQEAEVIAFLKSQGIEVS
jgi:hypothetical protein